MNTRSRFLSLLAAACCALAQVGCVAEDRAQQPVLRFPEPPTFDARHRYTLDELVQLSVHRNASIDVSRYESEAALGLVDQVKSLWLPFVRFNFAAVAYDNDLNYEANAFDIATINVPITGQYNLVNTVTAGQILATGGKRISGLKQAKMYAAIQRLQVLRQMDAVAFDVATYYHLVVLTTQVDQIVDDALRRLRVLDQVAGGLNARGSLRASRTDTLQADFLIVQLEQLRIALQAGRKQAYLALRQAVGISRDEPLELASLAFPPNVSEQQALGAYAAVTAAFANRPELRQVDLFAEIRAEQTRFAKAAWAPNVIFLGNYTNIAGNHNTILGAIDGLIASFIVDVPIYDPVRRGKLREALGLEYAAAAFQRQVEELITLESEVTAIEVQKALVTTFRTARGLDTAQQHEDATRQAYSRELIPSSSVAIAIAINMLAKAQHQQALFAYHNGKARLKRVTADRESLLGY